MSNQAAAIPAAPPCVFLKSGLRALPNPMQDHSGWYSPSSRVGQGPPRRAAVSADFISRERDESDAPERVSRSVSRVLFGHGFRACPRRPAAARSSALAAPPFGLRSLQILFGKNAEKISPDPP